MSGLDKLIAIAEEIRTNGYGPSPCRVLLASRIEGVASEIEQDIFRATVGEVNAKIGCAWRNLAEYMNGLLDGKYEECDGPGIYRRCERETFQEWLDKWYIPKPLDADREPISFDKLYDKGCGAIDFIHIYSNSGKYGYSVESHDGYVFSPEQLKGQEPDSIEKLRKDICCAVGGCVIGFYRDCDACKDCDVTEYLARAEKLFGGDAE